MTACLICRTQIHVAAAKRYDFRGRACCSQQCLDTCEHRAIESKAENPELCFHCQRRLPKIHVRNDRGRYIGRRFCSLECSCGDWLSRPENQPGVRK